MTLELSTSNTTELANVEPWMFKVASGRAGAYTVRVAQPYDGWSWIGWGDEKLAAVPHVVEVNFTGEEFAKLDKVITNQTYAESKSKVQSAIVYQHASVIWPTHTPDDVAMRTLGAWAITQYRCNGTWVDVLWTYLPCCSSREKQVHLDLVMMMPQGATNNGGPAGPPASSGNTPTSPGTPTPTPLRNALGYVEPGHGNEDTHPLGGTNDADSEIRALREDRVVENEAGVGVVGQSTEPDNAKQIVGVISLPVTDPPNVYAKELANIDAAIDSRITKKQRAFTANKDDTALLGRLVSSAIGNHPKRSLFSAQRVVKWWETHLFDDLKSGKWTDTRLQNTIENLCARIQPAFRLSCDVKLEPMPEGKAPRMLIADGDEGQVLALLTICCIEDLIKKHLPKKTIKGLGKRQAMERIAAELRAPKAAYAKTRNGKAGKVQSPGVSIFEGDGSAWDTTCSAKLRDCVENPVILHVGRIIKVMMTQPDSWVDAHYDVSVLDKLTMSFKKNAEFGKFVIDAIRRSGHRGTSCLNWWVNFTCWHCAIFEEPELFLDPDQRYGVDHSGIHRWLASGFEGDDSILSTTPPIEEKSELYVSLMQRWERLGFNMKIFLRSDRALFTGYYLALDKDGPTGTKMPEVDRCFARAGISCSPTMIKCFKDEDRAGCMGISRAGALSRAYEFAGCSPTISSKYLRFYESMGVSTHVDRDLMMRTTGEHVEFSEPDIVADINFQNGAAMTFDSSELDRFAAVGFPCSQEELSHFVLRVWEYDVLRDWAGFRESLPASWRS